MPSAWTTSAKITSAGTGDSVVSMEEAVQQQQVAAA